MSNAFLFNKESSNKDTRFKDLVEKTIKYVDDDTIISLKGSYSFSYCSKLTSVNLPLVESEVGSYTFYYCSSLTNINLPLVIGIGSYCFSYCLSLIKVTLPSVKYLDNNAFYSCSKLTSIDLPSVTSIDSYAFGFCSELISLIIRTTSQICKLKYANIFIQTPINNGTGYIYVPSALIESYKTATNWSTFASQFRALEDYTIDGTITGELDPNKI